jgi:hypothetical protein
MLRAAVAAALLSLSLASPAAADDQSAANRLFIEATRLIEEARTASEDADKAAAYAEALGRLERIIRDHPGSDLAVRLVSEGQVGTVSLPMLRANTALATELTSRPAPGSERDVSRLRSDLEEQRARTAELRQENQVLADQLAAARDSLSTTEALQARVGDLESRLAAEQQKSAQLTTKLDAASQELAALRGGGQQSEEDWQETDSAEQDGATQEAAVTEQPTEQLTAEDITNAIKEALQVGTERVVERVGAADGFNADPAIHVPLPENLKPVDEALSAIGMGALTDDLELRLNRAAEAAAPQAKELFFQAISDMTVDDINAVFRGPDDAATQYFRGAMSAPLRERMRPVVEDSLARAGAVQAYEQAIGQYETIPMRPDVKADLTEHTLDYAMDGLFHYLAVEEAAIRNDAVNRTTELLQRAFAEQGG